MEGIWNLLEQGGPLMIPIGLCSLASLTILIEKTIELRRGRILPKAVVDWLRKSNQLDQLPNGRVFRSPAAQIIEAISDNSQRSLIENRQLLQSKGQAIEIKMQRGLRTLEIITTIAPLLGLAGTVQGLIHLFGNMNEIANLENLELAKGIGIALMTTFAGLLVSIPSVIGWHFFHRRIEVFSSELETLSDLVLQKTYRKKSEERQST